MSSDFSWWAWRGQFYDSKSLSIKWWINAEIHSRNLAIGINWNNSIKWLKVRGYEEIFFCLLRFRVEVVNLQSAGIYRGPTCSRPRAGLCITGILVTEKHAHTQKMCTFRVPQNYLLIYLSNPEGIMLKMICCSSVNATALLAIW